MKLIAIFGGKRSGKDTVADYIVDNLNGVKVQLGNPIKQLLYLASRGGFLDISLTKDDFFGEGIDREQLLPISNEQVYKMMQRAVEIAKTDFGFKPNSNINYNVHNLLNNTDAWSIRRLMQTLGTDICVASDKNVWVRYLTGQYAEAIESGQFDYFVVPDVRQTHEDKVLRGLGAKCLHIEKYGRSQDNHITEQRLEIRHGDFLVDNNGTLDELYPQINQFLEAL